MAGGAATVVAGASMLSACGDDNDQFTPIITPSPTPSAAPVTDADVLNFALNLEYLEAQFYSFAAFGTGLPASQLSGTGTQGGVTGGRQVAFTDPLVRQYAREIANDEIAHVAFLRTALGASARVASTGLTARSISGSASSRSAPRRSPAASSTWARLSVMSTIWSRRMPTRSCARRVPCCSCWAGSASRCCARPSRA